jgi:Leucine-rich repeat (LRR) protein
MKILLLSNQNLNEIIIPEGVEKVFIDNNNITEINHIPNSVKELYCYNNKINSICKLPTTLEILDISNNDLKEAIKLPRKIKKVLAYGNKIDFSYDRYISNRLNRKMVTDNIEFIDEEEENYESDTDIEGINLNNYDYSIDV